VQHHQKETARRPQVQGQGRAALFAKQVDGETVDLGNYVYMMAAHREIPLTKRMLEKLLEVEARDDDWNRLPVKLSKRRSSGCQSTAAAPFRWATRRS
jgi:hypothetical protein